MSWDASISFPACESCGHSGGGVDLGNYTHNTNPMMRRALDAVGHLAALGDDHLYGLNGKPCAEVGPMLVEAVAWWRGRQESGVMADLEPENGWGASESALSFWAGIAEACANNTAGTLELHG